MADWQHAQMHKILLHLASAHILCTSLCMNVRW